MPGQRKGIVIAKQKQRRTGREHGPGRNKQKIIKGLQVLRESGQRRNTVEDQDRAVGPGFQQARHKQQNQHELRNANDVEGRFAKATKPVERGEHLNGVLGLNQFIQGPEQKNNKNAEPE